jgi:hypothetical protein
MVLRDAVRRKLPSDMRRSIPLLAVWGVATTARAEGVGVGLGRALPPRDVLRGGSTRSTARLVIRIIKVVEGFKGNFVVTSGRVLCTDQA